mmetsp:Transcript_93870/g.303820  ORF Transcript_93870/g.303820 Transcript_93870/m.303820 type:complete len:87 (-) Transcript_93870:288-548(-)
MAARGAQTACSLWARSRMWGGGMQLHSWSRCPLCSLGLLDWHRSRSNLDSLLILDFSAFVTCLANSSLFGVSNDCLRAVHALDHGT